VYASPQDGTASDDGSIAASSKTTEPAPLNKQHASAPSASSDQRYPSISEAMDTRPTSIQWPATPAPEVGDPMQTLSPQSNYSNSTGYGTEVAPLRWFGLLAGDAVQGSFEAPIVEPLNDATLARQEEIYASQDERHGPSQQHVRFAEGAALQNPSKLLQISALSPHSMNSSTDERQYWQSGEPIQLKDHEVCINFAASTICLLTRLQFDIFQRFVTGVSLWIDLYDPMKHFSTMVPHLALYNGASE
jgi:hypothetical protein